jgi:aspartyl-tRNA(Asn)/glutamyl-tRNA(Gln) amidotransferase subunit B
MSYEIVIGLEVHSQLKTKSKIFCSCPAKFGQQANKNTCPVCLGMPGTLPVLNKQVLEYAVIAGLATHCEIQSFNQFARKNYFYPDLPKGYQISQFDLPFAKHGYVTININGIEKKINLTRIHMEEDAGKSIHGENLGSPESSYVDFNRTGMPLIEIVSEPELRSSEEARAYLTELKAILEYAGVSECNMEEGGFRCDANVSLRLKGSEKLGTRTEVKNVNSIRFVQKAIDYEAERQAKVLDQGDKIVQETRLYDSDKGVTFSMRGKEESHDYRYFPDPDLVPIVIDDDWLEKLKSELPELPEQKRHRFSEEYGISKYDAGVLTSDRSLAAYFEECNSFYPKPKIAANWIMGDLLRELKNDEKEINQCPVSPKALTDMLKLIDEGTINGKIAKTVFEEMYQTGKASGDIVKEKGLTQITDDSEIIKIIDGIIEANPSQLEEFRNGKEKLMGFFVGQVMKATKGQANPGIVNQLLKDKLKST